MIICSSRLMVRWHYYIAELSSLLFDFALKNPPQNNKKQQQTNKQNHQPPPPPRKQHTNKQNNLLEIIEDTIHVLSSCKFLQMLFLKGALDAILICLLFLVYIYILKDYENVPPIFERVYAILSRLLNRKCSSLIHNRHLCLFRNCLCCKCNSSQCSTTGVTKAVVCIILYVG